VLFVFDQKSVADGGRYLGEFKVVEATADNPSVKIERVNELTGLGIPDGDYQTLAGFILAQMGRVPMPKERFRWREGEFEILAADARRIRSVRLRRRLFLARRTSGRGPIMSASIPARIRNYFFTGVVVIAPTAVSVYLLYGAFTWVDGLLGGLLRHPRLGGVEIPGVGFVTVIAIILLTGFLASNYLGRRVVGLWDGMLTRIPLLNTIYAATKQIGSALLGQERVAFREVVWVEFPRKGVYSLAFTMGPGGACGPAPGAQTRPQREAVRAGLMPTTRTRPPASSSSCRVSQARADSVEEAIKLAIRADWRLMGEAAGRQTPPRPRPVTERGDAMAIEKVEAIVTRSFPLGDRAASFSPPSAVAYVVAKGGDHEPVRRRLEPFTDRAVIYYRAERDLSS
jgi:uncharacterized membrane protein